MFRLPNPEAGVETRSRPSLPFSLQGPVARATRPRCHALVGISSSPSSVRQTPTLNSGSGCRGSSSAARIAASRAQLANQRIVLVLRAHTDEVGRRKGHSIGSHRRGNRVSASSSSAVAAWGSVSQELERGKPSRRLGVTGDRRGRQELACDPKKRLGQTHGVRGRRARAATPTSIPARRRSRR